MVVSNLFSEIVTKSNIVDVINRVIKKVYSYIKFKLRLMCNLHSLFTFQLLVELMFTLPALINYVLSVFLLQSTVRMSKHNALYT